jgi:hypothetical protein
MLEPLCVMVQRHLVYRLGPYGDVGLWLPSLGPAHPDVKAGLAPSLMLLSINLFTSL